MLPYQWWKVFNQKVILEIGYSGFIHIWFISPALKFKWTELNWKVHDVPVKMVFSLFKFASVLRNSGKREEWIKKLKVEIKKKTQWKKCGSGRVGSEYYIDFELTVAHPFQSQNFHTERKFL